MGTHRGISGKFTPKNPQKYVGDCNNIIYRSLLERSAFVKFDENPMVLAWGSEEIFIEYFWSVDGTTHRYFPDLIARIRQKDGTIVKCIIEIKPEVFVNPPKMPKKKTNRYDKLVLEYIKNMDKWKAAEAFADKNGMIFQILTEKQIQPLSNK